MSNFTTYFSIPIYHHEAAAMYHALNDAVHKVEGNEAYLAIFNLRQRLCVALNTEDLKSMEAENEYYESGKYLEIGPEPEEELEQEEEEKYERSH